MTNSKYMRKLINVLTEGPLDSGPVSIDPMAAPMDIPMVDPAMDDPMDDPATVGPETKIEVTMKDGDDVEVEVYAKQGDELKRIMDLAGVFHKDKQSGTLGDSSSPLDAGPLDAGPFDTVPDAPIAIEPPVEPTDDMGYEDPIAMPGIDVPAETPADMGTDMGMDMGMDDVPGDSDEIDFEVSSMESVEDDMEGDEEELEEGESIIAGKKNDYGHPNPNLGQEPYELKAHDFSGNASKPVRFVPARSGDNPMVDVSTPKVKRGLKEYISDIEVQKKNLNEVDPARFAELVAKATPGTLTGPKAKAIQTATDELERDFESDPQKAKDLNPEQAMGLVTGSDEVKRVGFADTDEENVERALDKVGKEFEEGKRQYSFKQEILPFQGLTGTQKMRKKAIKSAKKSLRNR